MNDMNNFKNKYFKAGLFDMSSILEDEDIEIFNHNLKSEGYIGYLAKESRDQWSIGVEQSLDAYYKRFVIAHELGHFFLHSAKMNSGEARVSTNSSISYKTPSDITSFSEQEDFEANQFAANLLLPRETLIEILSGFDYIVLDTRKKLSKYFGVPEEAVFYRLKEMGYEQR